MATPKPRPTRMKVLEGNPGRRPLSQNEPSPSVMDGVPKPPSHLNKAAKKEWRSIAAKLHRLGLLTEVDITALALYCQSYARWVEAEEKLLLTGLVIKTINGNVINSPYVNIASASMRDCHKFLIEFGMTPSSRTKVSAATQGKKSKFIGLISGVG